MPGFQMPAPALDWLTDGAPRRVLTLSGAALPTALTRAGHEVFAIDKSVEVVARLLDRGTARPTVAVAAQAESLPFDPCQFDVVIAHQVFHRYAPGLVLSEMARVLRPGGHVALSYLVRDDSVPWVRRLVAITREIDPRAMAGQFGDDAVDALLTSKYFPTHESRDFRHWVPISRRDLVAMVAALPAVKALEPTEREPLLERVGALYDDHAPGSGGLRLPYQLRCWRARVDHEELTAPIQVDDDGLVIPL